MADYYTLLSRAVANLPKPAPPPARKVVYDRARKALVTQLRSLRPPLPEVDIAREESALDAAIARIESELGPSVEASTPETAGSAPKPASPPSVAPKPAAPPPSPSAAARQPAPPAASGVATAQSAPGAAAAGASGPPRPVGAAPPTPTPAVASVVAAPPVAAVARPAAPPRPKAVEPVAALAPKLATVAPAARSAPPAVAAPGASPRTRAAAAPEVAPPQVGARDSAAVSAAPAPIVSADEPERIAGGRASDAQRPVAPSPEPPRSSSSWVWVALAVLVGIVGSIAVAAFLMRQRPQDLAIAPPPGPPEATQPQSSAKIAERVQAAPVATGPSSAGPGETSTQPEGAPPPATAVSAPDASASPPSASAAAPVNPPADATPALPVAARAAMLIAAADDPQKPPAVNVGSVVWSTIPAIPGQPATIGVKAEADIPDLKMHATMTLRKNTDPTLQATHTIDLKLSFADGAPFKGVADVGLPQMRREDSASAEALNGGRVKINDTYFLIGLARSDADLARNLDLMSTRAWFDFPLLLEDKRIAKLVFEKAAQGEAALKEAFAAWK